jgi:hypothetical protein
MRIFTIILIMTLFKLTISSNGACSYFCNQNYLGMNKGKCISDAARGLGDCFKCGPKSDQNLQVCLKETNLAHCCSANSPSCCGAQCVNLLTDSQNCGSCGNVCVNSQCQNGQCQSESSCTHNYFHNFDYTHPFNTSATMLTINPYESFTYGNGTYVFSGGYNGIIMQLMDIDLCLKPYYHYFKQFILNSYSFDDFISPTPQTECYDNDYVCQVFTTSRGLNGDCYSPTVPKSCWLGLFMTVESVFPFLV